MLLQQTINLFCHCVETEELERDLKLPLLNNNIRFIIDKRNMYFLQLLYQFIILQVNNIPEENVI